METRSSPLRTCISDGLNPQGSIRHGRSRCSGRLRLHVQPELGRLFRRRRSCSSGQQGSRTVRSRSADRHRSRATTMKRLSSLAVLNRSHLPLLGQPCAALGPNQAARADKRVIFDGRPGRKQQARRVMRSSSLRLPSGPTRPSGGLPRSASTRSTPSPPSARRYLIAFSSFGAVKRGREKPAFHAKRGEAQKSSAPA